MKTDWILTYTGKKFFPLEPQIGDIDIIDIAHALSNTCRFAGHCKDFYSVAQHCCRVADKIWNETEDGYKALCGLLHDASEAYLCDIVRPVKHAAEFSNYRILEANLQNLIDKKFNVCSTQDFIKHADVFMLHQEAFFLMPRHEDFEMTLTNPSNLSSLVCHSPRQAKDRFLTLFSSFEREANFQRAGNAQSLV